jgi:hypothetical protein
MALSRSVDSALVRRGSGIPHGHAGVEGHPFTGGDRERGFGPHHHRACSGTVAPCRGEDTCPNAKESRDVAPHAASRSAPTGPARFGILYCGSQQGHGSPMRITGREADGLWILVVAQAARRRRQGGLHRKHATLALIGSSTRVPSKHPSPHRVRLNTGVEGPLRLLFAYDGLRLNDVMRACWANWRWVEGCPPVVLERYGSWRSVAFRSAEERGSRSSGLR